MARTDKDLQPGAATPLFVLTALIFSFAVASRFDVLTAELPAHVHAALLWSAGPLLLVTGYYESRIDHGSSSFPLWIQIQSRSLKWALTLGATFLVILLVQTLDWEFGPVDPSPPLEWPMEARAAWFAMFTFGMFFANYIATVEFLLPILRLLAWPARRLPAPLAVLLMLSLGFGLTTLALSLGGDSDTGLVARARSLLADPTGGAILTVSLATVPALLAPLFSRSRRPVESANWPSASAER
jgi:hypothetical protein